MKIIINIAQNSSGSQSCYFIVFGVMMRSMEITLRTNIKAFDIK